MKRLLFALTFAVLGLSASANSGDFKKEELSKSTNTETIAVVLWEVEYTCSNGLTITYCCWDSYLDAAIFAATNPSPCQ
jgi:hypothetical protein